MTLWPGAASAQTVVAATECLPMGNYREASVGVTAGDADGYGHHLRYASLSGRGSWLRYGLVDFSPLTDAYLTLCVRAADNSRICVREGNAKGKVIARVEVVVKMETDRFNATSAGSGCHLQCRYDLFLKVLPMWC